MSSKKKNICIYLGKVILITLLFMLCIRTFLIEPHTISSPQMETSLLKGDEVLIDKTAYGIRLPMTILSIPFTFDKLFGLQSYSTLIEAPYKRIFEKGVSRNDIILFNNPAEADKPLDKRSLITSRCIALPGDTILVEKGRLFINSIPYIISPDVISRYSANVRTLPEINDIIQERDIPPRNFRQKGDSVYFHLNKLEAFIINEKLQDSLRLERNIDTTQTYQLTLPSKGATIDINNINITIYKQVILAEQGNKANIRGNKLFIDEKEYLKYTFEDDYYWVIADNPEEALDSRSLGFIPFKNIIGKIRYIWYRSDKIKTGKEQYFISVN